MRNMWILAFASALGLTLATPGCASKHAMEDDDRGSKEQAVTQDQLPAAVKATIMKEAGGGKIEEIDKLNWHGKTVYEADVMLEGKKWEIAVREDGQLLKKALDEEADGEDDKDDKDDKEDKDDKDDDD